MNPLHHVTSAPAKFEVATSNSFRGDALTRNTLFDLALGVNAKRNIAQYHLHRVTYAPAKFEVATPYGLGGNAFTRKNIN